MRLLPQNLLKPEMHSAGKFPTFLLWVEQYPELKANQNFLQLQSELKETENKIVMARQFYNDTVTKYNTAIMMFPRSIFAGLFGFRQKDLLAASEEERQAVHINANMFQ